MTSCFRKIDENEIVVCLKRLLVLLQLSKVMTVMKLIWIILWGQPKLADYPPGNEKIYPLSFAGTFESTNFPAFSFGGILLMEEILHHLGCIKAYK